MRPTTTLLFTLVLSAYSAAQEKLLDILPLVDGKVTYSEVVQADSLSQAQIYARIHHWLANSYRSAKDVVQVADKERGEVIGKGFATATWQVTFYSFQPVDVWHTVTVQAKDGKYRYQFTDFTVDYTTAATQYGPGVHVRKPLEEWLPNREKQMAKFYPQVDAEVQRMVSELKAAVASGAAADDW